MVTVTPASTSLPTSVPTPGEFLLLRSAFFKTTEWDEQSPCRVFFAPNMKLPTVNDLPLYHSHNNSVSHISVPTTNLMLLFMSTWIATEPSPPHVFPTVTSTGRLTAPPTIPPVALPTSPPVAQPTTSPKSPSTTPSTSLPPVPPTTPPTAPPTLSPPIPSPTSPVPPTMSPVAPPPRLLLCPRRRQCLLP